jgi:hypothetical protein
MIEASANVSEADLADLNKAIDLMIRKTTRLGRDAVHRAAIKFVTSAKAGTPKAKKLRKLRNAGDAGPEVWRLRKGKRVLVQSRKASQFYLVRRQKGKPMRILIPDRTRVKGAQRKKEATIAATELKRKYRSKPNIGAAKNSWNRAFNDLGKSTSNTMKRRSRRVKMASKAKKLGLKFSPAVRITNDLSYLTKIAPRLEGMAMRKAGKSLLHAVENGIEAQIKRF